MPHVCVAGEINKYSVTKYALILTYTPENFARMHLDVHNYTHTAINIWMT